MRIDKLVIRKTHPSVVVIREIKFNLHGLSLIVDNTPNVANNIENNPLTNLPSDSGNNVGKTTVIKVIDLCLGAKSTRDIYHDPDTKSENIVIKNFLSEYRVQAELLIIDNNNQTTSLRRDLFHNGKHYINNEALSHDDYIHRLKRLFFDSEDAFPTFRQLINKFVRVSNASADSMIKFLPSGGVTNDTYDAVYSFLFQILDDVLVSKKNSLCTQLQEAKKAIAILEKSSGDTSISLLKQKIEVIVNELTCYTIKRKNLSYMDEYKYELNKKRKISVNINELEEKAQILNFETSTIKDSIQKLSSDKSSIDMSILKKIYIESHNYFPELQKKFEELVAFHNAMIQNRIDFISQQLVGKETQLSVITAQIDELVNEKEKITIDILDEGLLDELNVLNLKIEELSVEKGEVQNRIKQLEEQEQIKNRLLIEISNIEKMMDETIIDERLKSFNLIFSEYSEKLYHEKYFFAYNPDWKAKRIFPVSVSSLGGNVGTGKKKAVIVAFDLAYLKYAENMHIQAPQFVIHDKLENTHINQLRTIVDICQNIQGQYIIPILRERINVIESKYIEAGKVLELSTNDKFFKI